MSVSEPRCASGSVESDVLVITVLLERVRDPQTSDALRDQALALVDAAATRHAVVDLKRVEFLGSLGLLALLAVRRRLEGGRVVLCNMSETVRTTLEVCRLISSDPTEKAPFEARGDLETALAQLAE